jgi:arsenite methyltransferase
MSPKNSVEAINIRYSELADACCRLSCGGALNYAKPEKGEVCADLGSGRGLDVLRMAEAVGPEGFAYGIDISEGMLKKAKRNVEKLGIKNARFLKSPLEIIPLESGSIDVLISNCTINHADDKPAVWREVHRVLKPGGRFVVSDIYAMRPVPEKYAADPEAVAECWAGAVTKEVYFETLNRAGFTDAAILEESDPYQKGEIEVASFTITSYKA